jgi:hypothetical protein
MPRFDVEYNLSVDRKNSWARFGAPPLMSPPTRLALRRSSSAGGRYGALENRVAKARRKTLHLRLDSFRHVGVTAVRNMAVTP